MGHYCERGQNEQVQQHRQDRCDDARLGAHAIILQPTRQFGLPLQPTAACPGFGEDSSRPQVRALNRQSRAALTVDAPNVLAIPGEA